MDPYAGTLHIWGYITGAVISGELAGFSTGYKYGLGSMIVAHVFTSILMICVSVNLVELTTTLPFTSGSATFAKAAYGGAVGFIIGVAYLCDMIFFGLEACQFFAVVLQTAFETSDAVNFGYWVATIALCFVLNMRPKVFFNVIMGISIVSVLCILVPILVFSSQFNAANAWKTILPDGNITNIWFPFGVWGVIQSFPHSLYLVVCFESLPVSVEEADNVGSNMPRGMFAAVGILLGLSWISLILCAGLPPFASELQKSDVPFLTIFSKLLPDGLGFIVWIIALPPIFASQLSLFYAGTRFAYGLSRSGYLPSILSCTTAHGAPYISMGFISFIWLLFGAILTFQQDSATSPIYLSIGSMFALIAYIVEPLVYVKLKYSLVNIPRPFKISELSGISTSMASFFIAMSFLLGKIVTDRFWQWGFLSIVILYITAIPFITLLCVTISKILQKNYSSRKS
ncbi:amino acid transporter [Rhizoclosmatium globosum]|uniref:Amino acid transporter n=1 Tax=Rhizoclosmatium globosum TaxID=329046 RepID=A0A1Y2CNV6_9FUNG|nr:amino acid transporter [Rhizoclosmatium globosum]|eukprot:ORY48673.1 amino acid transporter [Rhizoclosmatium globosum]